MGDVATAGRPSIPGEGTSVPVLRASNGARILEVGESGDLLIGKSSLHVAPVEAITNEGADNSSAIVHSLSGLGTVVTDVLGDQIGITITPVGKVEGDEDLEANSLSSGIGVIQLVRGVAVGLRVSAVEGENRQCQ